MKNKNKSEKIIQKSNKNIDKLIKKAKQLESNKKLGRFLGLYTSV